MTESVVVAMVEVSVAKCPTSSAGSTGGFDPEDGNEGVTPVCSEVQPCPACHPGPVPAAPNDTGTGPRKARAGFTHLLPPGPRNAALPPPDRRRRSGQSRVGASS